MLEDYAYLFTNQAEAVRMIVGIGVSVVGFIVALRVHWRATWTLRRVPYLIMFSATVALGAALPLLWVLQIEAMQNGVLWILTAAAIFIAGLFGYFLGVFSHGRSVSAFGDGRMAWLGAVPFVNLILFFKRPVKATKIGRGGIALNVVGVPFGLLLLVASKGISVSTDVALSKMQQRLERDPVLVVRTIEGLIRVQGLEKTLRMIASQAILERIDEVVVLSRVEAKGNTLRYIYDVSIDLDALPTSFRDDMTRESCENRALVPVFKAGGAFEHVYLQEDGIKIGSITVARRICGF